MREGSLEAPTRHPIAWQDPDFTDPVKLDEELRRVFDICHGCRRCFNLCDSFPKLFDLVDAAPTEELDSVDSKDFGPVIAACTLCDMCFLTKCPYVPPHSFNLDFPHLMLRARAAEAKQRGIGFVDREMANTDRNGVLASLAAPIVNWATSTGNALTRGLAEKYAGLDRRTELPKYESQTFVHQSLRSSPPVNKDAPAYGRKAVLYATCFVNYNDAAVGMATRAVLARNGVETEVVHPQCCGMPLLEQGRIAEVAASAKKIAAEMQDWIARGYDVIALVPSCALMLKFEWKLIVPGDANIERLAAATFDVSEYIVDIAKKEGIAPGLQPVPGGVAVHLACHARAQNVGQKAADMLKLLPDTPVEVLERCSGHGGSWGFKKENFDTALKVGRPAAKKMRDSGKAFVSSECPLAGVHIKQGMDKLPGDKPAPSLVAHPIQVIAQAYGIAP